MKKYFKAFAVFALFGFVATLAAVNPAVAALDLTGVTVDTADYITIATFLITALVAFWGIKKGIGLLGR